MAFSVDDHEAEAYLSRLLERVAAGEHIVISKAGTPVADLVPHRPKAIRFGGMSGELRYDDRAFDSVQEIPASSDRDDSATRSGCGSGMEA